MEKVEIDRAACTVTFTDAKGIQVLPICFIESLSLIDTKVYITSVSGNGYEYSAAVYEPVVAAWKDYLTGRMCPGDDGDQPDEALWSFHLDGMDYGMEEVSQLRDDLCQHRDAALKANDFTTSVLLSHVIATMYNMAEKIWGDAWVSFQDK
jgi:hypothetical protein